MWYGVYCLCLEMPRAGNYDELVREHGPTPHGADSVLYGLMVDHMRGGGYCDTVCDKLSAFALGRVNGRSIVCRNDPPERVTQDWRRTAMRDIEMTIALSFHVSVRRFALERVRAQTTGPGLPQVVPTKSAWQFATFAKKVQSKLRAVLQNRYIEEAGSLRLDGPDVVHAFRTLLGWACGGKELLWHGFWLDAEEQAAIIYTCLRLYTTRVSTGTDALSQVSVTVLHLGIRARPLADYTGGRETEPEAAAPWWQLE